MERQKSGDGAAAGADKLLDGEALGLLLGLGNPDCPGSAARAIRARIERNHPMPPCITLPGLRRRLWRRSTVERWLDGYEAPLCGKKGGRPRKLDLMVLDRLKVKRRENPDPAAAGTG